MDQKTKHMSSDSYCIRRMTNLEGTKSYLIFKDRTNGLMFEAESDSVFRLYKEVKDSLLHPSNIIRFNIKISDG